MNEYNAPNMNYLAPGLAGAQLCPASPDGCCEARDMSQCSSADGWLTLCRLATSRGLNVAAFCNIVNLVDFLLGYMVKISRH